MTRVRRDQLSGLDQRQHIFASQYNHATGEREARNDSYRVDVNAPRGALSVRGGFTPTR